MKILPLSDVGGAEVRGLDIAADLQADTRAQLEEAFLEYGVLLFRDRPLDARALVRFARGFGPVQPHVQRAYQHPEVPEVVMMTNRKADGSFDEVGARRGSIEKIRDGWHSDLSYDPKPAKATVLHALEIPSRGGNTCFCNASLAYESLPAALRERLRGVQAEFLYGGHYRNKNAAFFAAALDQEAKQSANAVHPVIAAHPETGRPGIYANPLITTRVLGVEPEESEAILETLFDALDAPGIRFEHEWRVGDTLMWDNRGGFMHTGRLDYPRDEARRFIRTTVSGGPIVAYDG